MNIRAFKRARAAWLALSLSLALSACGGGAGTGNSSTANPPTSALSAGTAAVTPSSAGVAPGAAVQFPIAQPPIANAPLPPSNPAPVVPALKDSSLHYVGIGITDPTYWDGMQAMADLSREGEIRDLTWGFNYSPDINGAPGQDFLLVITSLTLPSGTYKLQFSGTANVIVTGGGVSNMVYDAPHNLSTADVVLPSAANGNTWLTFTHTHKSQGSAATGVSNLHLWRPGYPTDGSVQFTKEFIQAMKTFQLIRGMDFSNTNLNGSVNWEDRCSMVAQQCASTIGSPWELMVILANATGNDIWLNVPAKASDQYILKLAQLIRYGSDGVQPYTSVQANPTYPPLNSSSRVYLEYGNEVWNSGPAFHCFGWALALAQTATQDTTSPVAYDGVVNDQYDALRRWIAYRSSFISLSFRSVFGDSAMMSRIRPVLTAQVGNGNGYLSAELAWADGFYSQVRSSPANAVVRKVTDIWYGGGGAAYYDSTSAPTDTQPGTMAAYFANLPSPAFASSTATDATWTRGYGLVPIAYEGGPGPGGSPLGTPSSNALISYTYNLDPRMKDRMLASQDIWYQNGGEILSYFVYADSPAWGFLNGLTRNTVSDTNTTKLQAIQAIDTRPRAAQTLGAALPAKLFLNTPGNGVQVGTYNSDPTLGYRLTASPINAAQSQQVLVPVRSLAAGTYKLSVDTAWSPANGQLEVLINGVSAGYWTTPANSSTNLVRSSVLTASLPAGLSVIRLRSVAGTFWVTNLVVTE